MSKVIKQYLFRIFLGGTFLAISACNQQQDNTQAEKISVRTAKIVTVELHKENQQLSYPAVIYSKNLSPLAFEVGGLLSELNVIEAQDVKKGEVLAKLDQRDLQLKLKSAKAQYNVSNTEYKRAQRLIKANAISRSELDTRKSKKDVDKTLYNAAQKALQGSVLIAPFSGNIAQISVELRQVVQSGETAITILGEGGLEATFNLPSNILSQVRNKQTRPLGSYITMDAAPELHIAAQFKEISLQADVTSQTHAVSFSFEPPENLIILPGMTAIVWFKDPRQTDNTAKLSVPLTSITTQGKQKFVWVVNAKTMQVNKREIAVIEGIGKNLLVANGLEAGEMIISAGVSYLAEGMTVRPWSIQP
ncbi:MAG: efflux RND transporter periplasmic adaptor subunit [Oceanospirillaceae bacterium]